MANNGKVSVFWSHPCLMDYRKPLFDLVQGKYKVKFLFWRRGRIDNGYDAVYGGKKIAGRLLPLGDVVQLYRGIRESDVFISSNLFASHSIAGIIIARLLRKKVIIWEELSVFLGGFRWAARRLASTISAKCTDAFFVLGEPHRRGLCKLGVPHEAVFLANEYPGHDYSKMEARRIESLPVEGKQVILYLGRLVPYKGVEYLLEAYHLLESAHANVLLLVVGDGPLRDALREKAEALGLKSIHFLKWVTDIRQKKYLFDISTMMVVPTVIRRDGVEGGPMVVVEALSAGTPVLGTDGMMSSRQFIRDGVNGFIVPHSDARALYEKMEEIISWGDREETLKKVQAQFKNVRGFDYQFETLEKAIEYCLAKKP